MDRICPIHQLNYLAKLKTKYDQSYPRDTLEEGYEKSSHTLSSELCSINFSIYSNCARITTFLDEAEEDEICCLVPLDDARDIYQDCIKYLFKVKY